MVVQFKEVFPFVKFLFIQLFQSSCQITVFGLFGYKDRKDKAFSQEVQLLACS